MRGRVVAGPMPRKPETVMAPRKTPGGSMADVSGPAGAVLRARFGGVGGCEPARQEASVSVFSSAARMRRDQECWSALVEVRRERMLL